jgi:hypothetical protein
MSRVWILAGSLGVLTTLVAGGKQPGAVDGKAEAMPAPTVPSKPLPAAEDVLKRYIDATGGERAYASLRTRVSVWKVEIPAARINGRAEMTQQVPERMLSVITADGLGETRHVLTDGLAWERTVVAGNRLLTGGERAQLRRPGILGSETQLKDLYDKIETVRRDMHAGREVVVLRMTPRPNEGGVEEWLFDEQAGLLTVMRMVYDAPIGRAEAEVELSDWREVPVQGEVKIRLAHRTSRRVLGHEQIMTLEKVSHNVAVDEGLFAVPEEIRQAAERERTTAPATKPDSKPEAKPQPGPDEPGKK